MCHGFSAAVGKAGALVAGVVFAMVDNRVKFWISAFCGLAGEWVALRPLAMCTICKQQPDRLCESGHRARPGPSTSSH